MSKKKTIVIDTINAIQNDEFLKLSSKANYDDWRDFGVNIQKFILELQTLGFECVLILGSVGSGKSYGIKYLPSETNVWFNADKKNPTWRGGKDQYGTKVTPNKNHIVATSYKQIINTLQKAVKADRFEDRRYAFIVGHIEHYGTGGKLQRLKVLGKMATKMQIEGRFENVFYTDVKSDGSGKPEYRLLTYNTGKNTGRTVEGLFDEKLTIPNNYQAIVEALDNY